MQQIPIEPSLWHDVVAVAQRQRRRPETIIRRAVREYLQRVADEELLAYSERAARQALSPNTDVEELVRQHRRSSNPAQLHGA